MRTQGFIMVRKLVSWCENCAPRCSAQVLHPGTPAPRYCTQVLHPPRYCTHRYCTQVLHPGTAPTKVLHPQVLHPGTPAPRYCTQVLHPGSAPRYPCTQVLHPGTAPRCCTEVLHPGTAPTQVLHPGAAPWYCTQVPLHPGTAPRCCTQVLHPGAPPWYCTQVLQRIIMQRKNTDYSFHNVRNEILQMGQTKNPLFLNDRCEKIRTGNRARTVRRQNETPHPVKF